MTIMLDSHLLLLLIVGTASRSYLAMHRRLQDYTEDDFDLLLRILTGATAIVVTPHILTETSNWAGYIREPARTDIYQTFRALVRNDAVEEESPPSRPVVSRDDFVRVGLTDAAMLHVAAGAASQTLLTADLNLYLAGQRLGLSVENFHHYRAFP